MEKQTTQKKPYERTNKFSYGIIKKVSEHLGIRYNAAFMRLKNNDPFALQVAAVLEEERRKAADNALKHIRNAEARIRKAQKYSFTVN